MLGQPVTMLIPQVIGFRLTGALPAGRDRHRPRADRHRDAAQERRRRQVRRVLRRRARRAAARRSRDDREHVARVRQHLRDLPDRRGDDALPRTDRRVRRTRSRSSRPTRRRRACGARTACAKRTTPTCSNSISPRSSRASRARSARRTACRCACRRRSIASTSPWLRRARDADAQRHAAPRRSASDGKTFELKDGAVLIAAITSCTNTSNPAVLIARRPARAQRTQARPHSKPWVKTSLAPGSRVVTDYLQKAGLLAELEGARLLHRGLRLHDLHRQFGPAASGDLRGRARRRPRCRRRCSRATATSKAACTRK